MSRKHVFLCFLLTFGAAAASYADEPAEIFTRHIAPMLSSRCLACHNDTDTKGGLSVASRETFFQGGDSGAIVEPQSPDASYLIDLISGDDPEMPKDADPLSADEVSAVRRWIEQGAVWPAGIRVEEPKVTDTDWWSLRPIKQAAPPQASSTWPRNQVDRFILARLIQHGLAPSSRADRRTLVRRVYFDLIGLPPSPTAIDEFINDPDPMAYEKLVDRLLMSPQYGERWARHWLDVVHYGDTHGYDKDKLREHAWPYRDYVIRSLNTDKPYERFVREQIAGDALWPDTRDGIEATGFIAAGPWDFIGHAEVSEDKIDGQVARNLDRDDMVTSTMNTFCSMTVQCARCHNHKFDPVTQEHYYSLQSVFAALDRADRMYDVDPKVARDRRDLEQQKQKLQAEISAIDRHVKELAGDELTKLDQELAQLQAQSKSGERPEFGYHSQIVPQQDITKWVQVDLGKSVALSQITIVGCKDDFNGIGEGFGFPVRFTIEASDDTTFADDVTIVTNQTNNDYPNPGVTPQIFATDATARYIRVTATRLVERANDYIFALSELIALTPDNKNVAMGSKVTAWDSIEAPVRWQTKNLVDGYYFGVPADDRILGELAEVTAHRQELLDRVSTPKEREKRSQSTQRLRTINERLATLPPQRRAYVGTIHNGSGAFKGRGHVGGKPRDVFLLVRGDVQKRAAQVSPGAVPIIKGVNWRFDLPEGHNESDRRVALADWIVHRDNPLTWRSIVNRVWHYHFGRGIVESANDFGRMGSLPTHPDLLDWLAADFRDNGQSLKRLHRLLLTSATYQQISQHKEDFAKIDGGNQFLWRMPRQALDAESIRDATLLLAGQLNHQLYGPAFRDFVLERPEHSPHYEYHKHDPDDPLSHRRSIYRFLVRSQQQPFMQTLDCADPSQSVARRGTTLTAIQALTLLNNKFMVRMSEHLAERLLQEQSSTRDAIHAVYYELTGRAPTADEANRLEEYAAEYGLPNTCRVLLNMNEFVFVD